MRDSFAGTVPRLHGNAVVQAPVLLTKTKPGGVISATTTLSAFEGPLFVTVMLNVTFVPGVAVTGAALSNDKSASVVAGTVAMPVLFAGFGSGVVELTVAVFSIGITPT